MGPEPFYFVEPVLLSGPGGIRTPGLFSAIEARSQLRYRPIFKGSEILLDVAKDVKTAGKKDIGELNPNQLSEIFSLPWGSPATGGFLFYIRGKPRQIAPDSFFPHQPQKRR